jgi:hypothetical protein
MALMKSFAVMGLAAVLAVAAQQTEQVDPTKLGPQVGEKAITFTLPDQTGTSRDLATLAGPNGTMLVFFRSSDW